MYNCSRHIKGFSKGVYRFLKIVHIPCFLLCISIIGCTTSSEPPLFQKLSSEITGINFKNEIIEDETNNILNFSNIYTGAGVGIGDFNNDGLPDIFLGGNMESSRLFLNQGDFKFKDITSKAGVTTDRWVTGVTVADINTDGWDDIYLSVSGTGDAEKIKNLLFLNNGLKKTGEASSNEITFTESAEIYGIADSSQCTHANFFDYDKDGDLDLFLIVNPTDYTIANVNYLRPKKINGEGAGTDKLYRNNYIENISKKKSKDHNQAEEQSKPFTDVSEEAGILIEGYSLSLNVSDLNDDNWPDIYITNDFLTNDIIYINNQNGTFTNRAPEMLKHTSFASMGIDVADINNDGNPEIYVLDMLPENNYRQKVIAAGKDYNLFEQRLKKGYEAQYTRNTLQLNNGDGSFSEVGQLFNVHKTDWSWSALLADYDNDGYRDLFVTNGFKRDLGNLDYIVYGDLNPFGSPEAKKKRKLALILEQPGAKLPNYIYKNDEGKDFIKKSADWGIDEISYSSGAAYVDLDLDGDLDLVVNNVGQEAFVYENRADSIYENHYLKLKLEGDVNNPHALGAKVWLYHNESMQFAELTTFRGYESTIDRTLHFGLGKTSFIDSLKVLFPDGRVAIQKNIQTDTMLTVKHSDAVIKNNSDEDNRDSFLFEEISSPTGLEFVHKEDLQVDFNVQPLLPHQHSQLGPAMAKGDINADGLEDVFIGAAAGETARLFLQNADTTFTPLPWVVDAQYEDTNALFFDADGDHDLDLYVCSGGVISAINTNRYQDRLYLNDGQGNFSKSEMALPKMPTSTKAVAVVDYDADGDADLFVGGRVSPGNYPSVPQSYLLENQNGVFKDVTTSVAPKLREIGMVTDALWADYDSDDDPDLILVGEWMPITIFKNTNGKMDTKPLIIPKSNGWWNTIVKGDFDNDGDLDYLAGNLGLNTDYRASEKEPISLYTKDYDKNGSLDPVLCQYLNGIEYSVAARDKLIEQIPPIKRRFNTYHKYAMAPFEDVFKRPELKGVNILRSYVLESCYIENLGNGNLNLRPLSMELQMAPIKKFLTEDINSDGFLDALSVGNDYSTEVLIGRYDAATGAVLLGNGNGNFTIRRGASSGFLANKNAQNMIKVRRGSLDQEMILVGNNSDTLQVFKKLYTKCSN